MENNVESLPPVLVFLVRECQGYSPRTKWGSFDAVGIRSIQDLYFSATSSARCLYAYTYEPPHAGDVIAVRVPLQLALEAAFFHVAGINKIVLNPAGDSVGAALPQQQIECSVPHDAEPTLEIARRELPALLGEIAAQAYGELTYHELVDRAAQALQEGGYFECYHLAHRAREINPERGEGWFYELFAFSFFGSADDALELYEQYPRQGSSEPHAQLLAARYRLLLKQLNEARTIFHTLSFNGDVGAIASSELARSYVSEKHYARALDAANAAISKNQELVEAHLLRGIALRGLSYDSGDTKGLQESYADFELVAKRGGYGAAEALYHAGTVCARLGALAEAETAFRQSLFQRDRISARDALIRTLCAEDKHAEAEVELTCLENLTPDYGRNLRRELDSRLKVVSKATVPAEDRQHECPELWASAIEDSVMAARDILRSWGVPIECTTRDFVVLDDFINRFAPDGEFPTGGRYAALQAAGHDVVARALGLHVADLLVSCEAARWGEDHQKSCKVVSSRLEVEIPVEEFVANRVLLGASGDNFSSLESLVLELEVEPTGTSCGHASQWWEPAEKKTIEDIEREVAWVVEALRGFGVELSQSLGDLEAIDLWIESAFEVGTLLCQDLPESDRNESDRLIIALGMLVGQRIVDATGGVWSGHEKPEGISVWSSELGRIFPVARMQRRVYLAGAAESAFKLSSLAWSVAVAAVTQAVRRKEVVGHEGVLVALTSMLPSIASFPEEELSGVVTSLLIGATL